MAVIIIGGGRGKRLAQDKCLIRIGGKLLLNQTIEALGAISSDIILVRSRGQADIPDLHGSVKVVFDILADRGALGGIYTGLVKSGNGANLVIGCDMPFPNLKLSQLMMELLFRYRCDAIVPRVGSNIEPLYAAYDRKCVPKIRAMLDNSELKIRSLLEQINTAYLSEKEIRILDPELRSFTNINDKKDLEKVKAKYSSIHHPENGAP